ncbi:unnamed protein product [Owenia fusiformis]|uniref:U3 small nucleolar RNA-associated protein 6 homolog n=1 Tax=Owenia fusiformis TaxID=6347 RepID=A0A8J1Y689_OWEFU|nr:unnamed protein product [Owenia fusiformis]
MAEFVQQRIEEMLPELEQMERVKLFTKEEARSILKKRKAYEYKLRRKSKLKEDFLQYIQYEINVLNLVRKRRQKIGYTFKRVEIDVAIVQRIHKLFQLALSRFQDDVKLWLSHIQFSKQRGEKASVSRIYNQMLQIHTRKPELWILAAKWEMEDALSTDNARNFLQRGLRFNPKSKELWRESYRMELLYADKLRKRSEILGAMNEEGPSDAVLKGMVALIVFRKAVEEFDEDIEMWLSFLPIARLFDFTQPHQTEILNFARERHGDKEVTWEAVAKQHLAAQGAISRKMEQRCCMVFEEAVKNIPTEHMWDLYLGMYLELLQTQTKHLDMRGARFLELCERASDIGLLSQQMALQWIEATSNLGKVESLLQVCSKCTKQHPTSVQLWTRHLTAVAETLVNEDTQQSLFDVFNKALKLVDPKESLPLYTVVINWCLAVNSSEIEQIFKRGCEACREVSVILKEQYLEWSALTQGIHTARKVYNGLKSQKPLSVEFFLCAVRLEKSQVEPRIKNLRQIYDDALSEFGESESGLWLDYIKMELEHPKGQPENASKLHWRAVKTLTVTDRFMTEYTLLQTGHLD